MIHTAAPSLLALAILGCSCPFARAQGRAAKAAQPSKIREVIDSLKKREEALKSLTLEMSTRGSYPSGLEFSTKGSLRVLAKTHFHIKVESTFGENADSTRVESVITPDGMWSYQRGPMDDVYTFTDKDLLKRLKTAEQALEADKGASMRNPGPLANGGGSPLGSAMLEALDLQFELEEQEATVKLDGVECRVISGRWRGSKVLADSGEGDLRAVLRVEVFLRAADGIPILMRRYNRRKAAGDDKPREAVALEIKLSNLVIDAELDPKSFVLKAPEGTEFKPVMEHRVSRAQINRIFQEYEDLQRNQKTQPKRRPDSGNGKKPPR